MAYCYKMAIYGITCKEFKLLGLEVLNRDTDSLDILIMPNYTKDLSQLSFIEARSDASNPISHRAALTKTNFFKLRGVPRHCKILQVAHGFRGRQGFYFIYFFFIGSNHIEVIAETHGAALLLNLQERAQ